MNGGTSTIPADVKRLVELLEPRFGAVRELDEPRPLEQLVLLMLARGASLPKARRLLKMLQTDYVDWNDVRVTNVREIAARTMLPAMLSAHPVRMASQARRGSRKAAGKIFRKLSSSSRSDRRAAGCELATP